MKRPRQVPSAASRPEAPKRSRSSRLLTLEDLRATAAARGGACLGWEFLGTKASYRWRCAEGHEWEARAGHVREGQRCPTCAGCAPYRLEELQAAAEARGGACLSPRVLGGKNPHRWRCGKGHEWEATPGSVVRGGTWCRACAGEARRLTLADLQAAAEARGGVCLSESVRGVKEKHRWRCAEGHAWDATPDSIRRGSWCPACARARAKTPQLSLADLQATAQARGGACLSGESRGSHARYRWRCAVGHTWEASARDVRAGRWCPACAGNPPLTLADLQATAEVRGGTCLSREALGARTPHRWRCGHGHEWEAAPDSVRGGSWCPVCARSPRVPLADLQAAAAAKGGACLATASAGVGARYRWRCGEGHEWEALGRMVRAGKWCPVCAGRTPLTLADLQATARARGGACLSVAAAGNRAHYRWRCAEGHEWEARGGQVRAGSWCPRCARSPRL